MRTEAALACILVGLGGSAAAALPVIHPTPQRARFTGRDVRAETVVVETRRAAVATADEPLWAQLPAKSGAYAITVAPGRVDVLAEDARGAFYARQTLLQLLRDVPHATDAQADPFPELSLEAIAKLGALAECRIVDWPDLPRRGTVEGFYGAPWSHASRLRQIAFYGRNKMNVYIYGPKDDPCHSRNWREPYPVKEAAQIRELVAAAARNHVDFVWAIHPGNSIRWTEEDMRNVIAKFERMHALGVRQFSVFFDDIGGEGARGEKQAELLNLIHREFVAPKGDVGPLVMCPTQYNRAWSGGDYLERLGRELDPSIHVMWTGNTVVHDITLEGQQWIRGRIGRPAYVWWNFPVTDFVRNRLCLGRVYGLAQEPGARESMSAFVSNPMDKPEASKIALFGVADYTWNLEGFRSDASWRAGVARLFPSCAAAMQTFANHNSDHGPNGHGYRREESVATAPTAEAVLEGLRSGVPDVAAAKALAQEYRAMAAAADAILACEDAAPFVAEARPWLLAFRQLGKAGAYALMSRYAATEAEAVGDFLAAAAAAEAMERDARVEGQPAAATGTKVMAPAMRAVLEAAGARVYTALSGRPPVPSRPVFTVQGGAADGSEKMFDGDERSFWHSGSYQRVGDWYAFDYGAPVRIRSLDLFMGGPGKEADYVPRGQLERSNDLVRWEPVGDPATGPRVSLDFTESPLVARALRYRVLEPNYLNPEKTGNTVWTAIREFSINRALPPTATSTVAGLDRLGAHRDDKLIGINRVLEVATAKPGDVIALKFPVPVEPTWLEINLDRGDLLEWADVQLLLEPGTQVKARLHEWRPNKFVAMQDALPKERVRAVALRHAGQEPKEIKLEMFKVDTPPSDPAEQVASLTDENLVTAYACHRPLSVEVAVPADVTEAILVGTARCTAVLGYDRRVEKTQDIQRIALPPGLRRLRLEHPAGQPGGAVNEVVFK